MPEYYVTSNTLPTKGRPQARTLVIKADYFETDKSSGNFNFYTKDRETPSRHIFVASVNPRDVLAITEKDAFQADWVDDIYDGEDDDASEDEYDDTCLECRFKEFLDSEEFFSEVWDIVHAYHTEEPDFSPPSETVASDPYPIEKWKDKFGGDWYGFHTPKGFVNFSSFEDAKDGVKRQLSNEDQQYWVYLDLSTSTKQVLETIQ